MNNKISHSLVTNSYCYLQLKTDLLCIRDSLREVDVSTELKCFLMFAFDRKSIPQLAWLGVSGEWTAKENKLN